MSAFGRNYNINIVPCSYLWQSDLRAMVDNHIHVRPEIKLPHPVTNSRERHYHQERSLNTIIKDLVKKCNTLNCLAKTHLISQYTILSERKEYILKI